MALAADPSLNTDTLAQHAAALGLHALVNVGMAALILIVGLFVASFVSRNVRRFAGKHPRMDTTLAAFFASLAYYAILAVVIIAVLTRFGVQTASLVAAMGAAALAVGLALQGTLSNLGAGVMIIFFRPYKIGDFVDISGTAGTVRDINLFFTELAGPDNRKVIVPNGNAWGNVIVNFSSNPKRRLELIFAAPYEEDIERVRAVIRQVMEAEPRFHSDPPLFVEATGQAESAINYTAAGWCDAGDFWPLHWDILRKMRRAFAENGIDAPYARRVQLVRQETDESFRVQTGAEAETGRRAE